MYKDNILRQKSYLLALKVVAFCQKLQDSREYILSKQLLRAGTSVCANIEESIDAQSKADFVAKLSISLKEARETDFWLRLVADSGLGSQAEINELRALLSENIALLVTIIKKTKQNTNLIST